MLRTCIEQPQDAEPPVTVDLLSRTPEHKVGVFKVQFGVPGLHTVRVTNTGIAGPASRSTAVRSDGFFYTF